MLGALTPTAMKASRRMLAITLSKNSWDYSIYPELTEGQEHVFAVIGETLYMIQLAEQAIQNCIVFVFAGKKDISLDRLYSNKERIRKKTLGQIVLEVRKTVEVHPQFDEMLKAFVDKRNFFVHNMFNDKDFGLATDEQRSKTEAWLNDLQDYAWNVQNVFLGCLMNWAKESGVYEHLPKEITENKHLRQVQKKPFHLLFRDTDKQ